MIAPELVATNAHVIAGEEDTTVTLRPGSPELDAEAVHYKPRNDFALLRVPGLGLSALELVGDPQPGTAGAVLGYPENRPFAVIPARLGTTAEVTSQDSYGRGPVKRRMTSLRGGVRSGNSGGPMVNADGRVLTTVFGSEQTRGRPAGGLGVPNEIAGRSPARRPRANGHRPMCGLTNNSGQILRFASGLAGLGRGALPGRPMVAVGYSQ